MRTRSSSNLPIESPPNPTTSNPKRRNRRCSKQPFILEESPIDTMADQRTMAELLRAPTEGYAEAILVPLILVEQFELKHRVARRWLEKEPPHSILTWENLGQPAGGLKKNPRIQSPLGMIYDANSSSSEIAKLTHAVNQQTSDVTTAMTDILKQFQATPPPAFVKAVKKICVTCGVAHPYYQCLAAGGNTFLKLRDNIQGYVSAAAVNYNQGYNRGNNFNQDSSYQALIHQNQVAPLSELVKIEKMNEINMKAMQTQINNVKIKLRNEMKTSIQASMSNQTNEIKNMMASLFQMNIASTLGLGSLPSNTVANPKDKLKAITTRSGIVLDGPTIHTPPSF
nr:hypothetical protein [Tanacetum cinerariifolium]